MGWTVNKIASTVDNNARNGLHGVTNNSIPITQIEQEVMTERMSILFESTRKGTIPLQGLYQDINGIPVDNMDIAKIRQVPSGQKVKHFTIPKIASIFGEDAIDYIGSPLRDGFSWKVYTDNRFNVHKYKMATHSKPYVWINASPREDGNYDAFLFNHPKLIQFISVTAIFEDSNDAMDYVGGVRTEEFIAPEWVIEEIISRLSKKYIYYYRQLNVQNQPNTQADITT